MKQNKINFDESIQLTEGAFEFEALNHASNYRKALVAEFIPWLKGSLIEVGAGIGQMTGELLGKTDNISVVEPNPNFCEQFRERFPEIDCLPGFFDEKPETHPDAIISVNVLEHIKDDEIELGNYARSLSKNNGALCLFVPARMEIYAQIDSDFGHYRRYTKKELREKLERAGFKIEKLHYYGFAGYFAWLIVFRILKKRTFNTGSVKLFDRFIFPIVNFIERHICRPPIGQSLIAVARAQKKG